MDKYEILLVLNLPFVFFGLIKSVSMYKTGLIQRIGFLFRLVFWGVILFGLLFAQQIFNFFTRHNLTDSTPLSLADVVLVTGVIFCLFLCMRLYTKTDILERQLTDLNEKLSVILSTKER